MDAPLPPPSCNNTAKLRLMCSYNGHILPRPNSKKLSYLGGETRIVAVDRRTTNTLSFLITHLSKALQKNRPFVLKYQLPNEDLDSLISVLTDEDLLNMLEEHDRITPPARIRLFLFPVLKFDQENNSPSGAESLVLERSSSFGSTGSSFSTSNSPPVGISERTVRVPSSESIDSKHAVSQEPLIEFSPEPPSSTVSEADISVSRTPYNIPMQKTAIDMCSYPTSQSSDVIKLQNESHLVQAGLYYTPQYIAPYYSVYQVPIYHAPPNQTYPVYLVPAMPSQFPHDMIPIQSMDNPTTGANRPPVHPQTDVISQSVVHKQAFGAQVAESTIASSASSSLVSAGSDRDYHHLSEPVKSDPTENCVQETEFDEEIAYNSIYKTQPSAPVFSSQYQTMAQSMTNVITEPSTAA